MTNGGMPKKQGRWRIAGVARNHQPREVVQTSGLQTLKLLGDLRHKVVVDGSASGDCNGLDNQS
jgi:hypothetical protein